MFRRANLVAPCILCVAILSACAPTPPSPPAPVRPTPVPHLCRITLYDQNGSVTARYDVAPNDIVRNDPLGQNIWFRVGGQEKHFHGSFQKECE